MFAIGGSATRGARLLRTVCHQRPGRYAGGRGKSSGWVALSRSGRISSVGVQLKISHSAMRIGNDKRSGPPCQDEVVPAARKT